MTQPSKRDDWWRAVDRKDVKLLAESAAANPTFAMLHGDYFEAGANEALTLVETLLVDHGVQVIRHVPNGPMSLHARLLATLKMVGAETSSHLATSALFSTATEGELVDELVARATAAPAQRAYIFDDIERSAPLKWYSWDVLQSLHRRARATVFISSGNHKAPLRVRDLRTVRLGNFKLHDVRECLAESNVSFNDPEAADEVVKSLFSGAVSQAPPLVYATLRGLD
jgi:hypothetical protein